MKLTHAGHGFINDIRKIVAKLPIKRQTLFFSATMPKDIADLADQMLKDPARVAVTPVSSTVERITQRCCRSIIRQSPPFWRSFSRPSRSTAHWSSPAPSTAPTRS